MLGLIPAMNILRHPLILAAALSALPAFAQQQVVPTPAAAPAPVAAPVPSAPPASSAPAAAGVPASSGVGQITHLSGTLVGRMDGQTQPRLLANRSTISPGETIATQGDTYARVKFNDGTEVVLRPNTQIGRASCRERV